jgi:hypothetical protein
MKPILRILICLGILVVSMLPLTSVNSPNTSETAAETRARARRDELATTYNGPGLNGDVTLTLARYIRYFASTYRQLTSYSISDPQGDVYPDDVIHFAHILHFAARYQTRAAPASATPSPPSGEVVSDAASPSAPFHGVTVHAHTAADYWNTGYTYPIDLYQRLASWGMNSITFHLYWTMLEPRAAQAGRYGDEFLTRLDVQVAYAQQYGLYPIIALRGPWETSGASNWQGWGNIYGWDVINYNRVVRGSGVGGRDRFISCLTMLARRYPACGFSLGFFPYHRQAATEAQREQLYTVTLPAMYSAIRAVTEEWLVIYPASQGCYDGRNTGQFLLLERYGWTPLPQGQSDPKVILGFNTHDYEYNQVVQGRAWNYDLAGLERHYAPVIAFKNKYAEQVAFGSAEAFNLNVHGVHTFWDGSTVDNSVRPILQSRLDWQRESLKICNREGFSWWYFVVENTASWSDPVEGFIEQGYADNAVGTQLAGYS